MIHLTDAQLTILTGAIVSIIGLYLKFRTDTAAAKINVADELRINKNEEIQAVEAKNQEEILRCRENVRRARKARDVWRKKAEECERRLRQCLDIRGGS